MYKDRNEMLTSSTSNSTCTFPSNTGLPGSHPVCVQVCAEEAAASQRGGHGAARVEGQRGRRRQKQQRARQGQHHGADDILKDSIHLMIMMMIV